MAYSVPTVVQFLSVDRVQPQSDSGAKMGVANVHQEWVASQRNRRLPIRPQCGQPIPGGSAAGIGQIRAAVRRCAGFNSPARAPAVEEYSSWHRSDPGTNSTTASVLSTSSMSRGQLADEPRIPDDRSQQNRAPDNMTADKIAVDSTNESGTPYCCTVVVPGRSLPHTG